MDGEEATLRVVVFLTEDDRVGQRRADEALLERARATGMAGATVLRAIEGFGRSGHVRAVRFPDGAAGLPLVFEVVDTEQRVDAFLDVLAQLVPGTLVTVEPVRRYGRRA